MTMRIASPHDRPVNRIRSVARLFTSEYHDTPWFTDRSFWVEYLDMLAAHGFNRFSLTFGLGYNFHWNVTDGYFYFAYPFLVDVPGYGVTVTGIDAAERQRNLDMLRFASGEAARRGLAFQLGLWTHAYAWLASPAARHIIEGLTPEAHAGYCRDALLAILEACPGISGVTLRIHGESGVPERSWAFWRTMFDGLARLERPVEIDLHAKGLDAETLRAALATGLPITVSPKFWAEHMGLPYHQAAIRPMERREQDLETATGKQGYMRVSEGTRPFTRYGYGDFLREDRDYAIVHRIWPGTQRLLLWGDPAMAAAYGRASAIAGSDGFEWMEPLTFRGREGAPRDGPRDGYADRTLAPDRDWRKYEHWYRLIGRLGSDPEADPMTWRPILHDRLGPAAEAAEAALAAASRILPLVTTAFHPSASNNYYWPELYTNTRIAWRDGDPALPFAWDTPPPGRFATVSPLDPEVFASVAEAVDEILVSEASGRYTPLDVAGWLEVLAGEAREALERFTRGSPPPLPVDGRRLVVDVAILAGLGRFFAGQMRAAVRFELYLRLGDRRHLDAALEAYRTARSAYAEAAGVAAGIYVADLAYGPQPWLRGHWSDRLDAIDADIEAMRAAPPGDAAALLVGAEERVALWLESSASIDDDRPTVEHVVPGPFRRGDPIHVVVELGTGATDAHGLGRVGGASSVQLRYRRMDQSEAWRSVEMDRRSGRKNGLEASIGAAYTDSPYPIQYRFVVRSAGTTWAVPGLDDDLCGQPYFVVRQVP